MEKIIYITLVKVFIEVLVEVIISFRSSYYKLDGQLQLLGFQSAKPKHLKGKKKQKISLGLGPFYLFCLSDA